MADDSVQVKFGAQISGVVDGVNQVKSQIGSLGDSVSGVSDSFKTLGQAAISGLALDTIGEAIGKYAELGEQIQRTAQITGLSTDDVQKFQFAVKMSGGDADTAALSLERFERNMAQAATGTGTAAQAYQNLGISVTDAQGKIKPLSEVLEEIAEKFSHVQDGAVKVEYAIALGGRTFGNMIPYLDRGKAGLDELYKALDQTGAKMSPDMVKSADSLAEHTRLLGSSWDGFANTLKGAVVPAIDEYVQATTRQLEDLTLEAQLLTHATDIWHAYWAARAPAGNGESGAMLDDDAEKGNTSKNYGVQFGPPVQTETLPPLTSGTGDKDTHDKLAREESNTQIELSKLAFAQIVQDQDALVAQFRETEAQKIDALKASAELQYQAAQGILDKEAAGYDQDSLAYKEVQDKKVLLAAQFNLETSKLNEQLAAAQKKQYEQELAPWKQLMGDMGGAFDTMINGILSGQQTLKQALARSFGDMLVKFTEVMTKMTAEYAVFAATSGKGILGFGATNPFAALSGAGGAASGAGGPGSQAATQALTTAITGNTATTVQNTGGILQQIQSGLQWIAEALGLTTSTTAQTAASATAATASTASATATTGLIPTITANIAALTANTTALFASKAIPSFDVGSWSVPGDMIAQIHGGEMIIPAAQAAQIRSGSASLGGGTGAASGGGAVTININAIDTQTGAQFLKQHAGVIAQAISGQARNFNPALRVS